MLRLPIILTIASFTLASKLNVVYEWKYVEYDWECAEQKKTAIAEGRYNYSRAFTIDVQKVSDGRIFVTTPPFYPNAVPASLSTVSKKMGPGGPLLKPYPNWHWYNSKNCDGIIGVWRITVDVCNRLWVLDGGKIGEEEACPAKLLVFDLNTDELLQRIEIPEDISHSPRNKTRGRLSYIVVETNGSHCEQTWVYIADFEGGGLVIYDGWKLWRLDDDVFHPEPITTSYSIAGEPLPSRINGPFGLTMTPAGISPHSRRLFLRGIVSVQENSVSVDDLHKSANAENDICSTTSRYRFPGPLGAQAFSRDGVLFFGLFEEIAIGCWNAKTPLNAENVDIVAQNNETLQYTSGLKITECYDDPSREEVWVSTTRFQKVFAGTLNFKDTNFRILRGSVDSLLKGCKCELKSSSGSGKS